MDSCELQSLEAIRELSDAPTILLMIIIILFILICMTIELLLDVTIDLLLDD